MEIAVSLRLKFNIWMGAVLAIAVAAAGTMVHGVLHRSTRDHAVETANLLMAVADATRAYTTEYIKPQLDQRLDIAFLPQTVPAFAATETIIALRKRLPEYTYKEATLNPTNPRDRASDWEADLVNTFRANWAQSQIVGERMQGPIAVLYVAKPIKITNPGCLACHSTPAAAPASMIKLYGEANGFGWKPNEIIGAQIVSVPMALPIHNADRAFVAFMWSLAGVFVAVFVVLNLMLSWMIVKPIRSMSEAADKVSTGDFGRPELPARGKDEISVLAASFNRMRRSLQKAMQMIEP
jgi:HAMP domain-containing protein